MTVKKLALIGGALVALGACSKQTGNDGNATSASSTPAASTNRVRGTLEAVAPDSLTVQTYGGGSTNVPLDAKTGFAWVVRSSLSTLKDGDFIGTATTGPDDAMRAVELVIFPDSMRGTGEGHYPWDVPGAIAANGGSANGSSAMTNGTVEQQSAMTNGTVTGGADKRGAKTLTISYKGGTSQVLVPESTPIVRFEPTQKSALAKGQKLFVVTPPGAKAAKFVAIGKDGVTPPM